MCFIKSAVAVCYSTHSINAEYPHEEYRYFVIFFLKLPTNVYNIQASAIFANV